MMVSLQLPVYNDISAPSMFQSLRARLAAKTEEKQLELLFIQWTEHNNKLSKILRSFLVLVMGQSVACTTHCI
jgi:hypothetical protein